MNNIIFNIFRFKINEEYMYKACLAKFTQHKDLGQLLLGTGNAILQEDSKDDYYWGIGADGTGKNMLGKTLMRIRHEINPSKKATNSEMKADAKEVKNEESKTTLKD